MPPRVIGIDLGTTNSCVAFLDGDNPVVIPNQEGSRTTPSVVAMTSNGERLVGQLAKRQAVTNPTQTVSAVKRLIGRKLQDPRIAHWLGTATYEVKAAENGDCNVMLSGKPNSPAEVSAMVLGKMRETAESYLGETITDAVITVPAYFDDAQRQATKDAGRIAGLNVLRILNEPTAAALAYGCQKGKNERIAVYDLGGGTFDISILELNEGVFQVCATNGDTYLGGEDFDRRLIDQLAQDFIALHGIDPRKDKLSLQRLKEAAERAKLELSSSLTTDVNLPFLCADASGPKHLICQVTRSQLEALVGDLIERTLVPCKIALTDSGLTSREIDQVILVGGQTRMPRVQQAVQEFFGRAPNQTVNPDEVVAVGAVLQGGILHGQVEEVLLLDVTPLSLGVETAGGVFTKIIPKNTTIPRKRAQIFSTAVDNQPFVEVHVLQGEREMADDCKSLARFQLLGIPPAPRGVPQIQVEFDLDANGIVSVSAKDLGTNKEQRVKVVPTSGLTEQEIGRIIADADATKLVDAHKREYAENKLRLEGLLYATERALGEYEGALGGKQSDTVRMAMATARAALEKSSLPELQKAMNELETAAQAIGETIYGQAAKKDGKH